MTREDEVALQIGRKTLRAKVWDTKPGKLAIRLDGLLYGEFGSKTVLDEQHRVFLREVFHFLENISFEEIAKEQP